MFLERLTCFILIILFCSGCSRSETISPVFKGSDRLIEPYGVVTHITRTGDYGDYAQRDDELQLLKSIGVNWIRCDITRGMINSPKKGERIYVIDSVLVSVERYGLNFLPILDRKSSNGFAWNSLGNYGAYLDSLTSRFSERLHYWEAMNEAGRIEGVEALDEKYLNALKLIHSKLKMADSANKILLTSITGVNGPFAEYLYTHDAGQYFDIMNFHTYGGVKSLQHILVVLNEKMKSHKWEKPVWITECGLHTAKDSAHQEVKTLHLEEKQAERLPQSFLLAFAYGVDKMFWYSLRSIELDPSNPEHNFGFLHGDLSAKPALWAYKTLIEMCPSGSLRPTLKQKGDFFVAKWEKTDGTRVFAAWVREGSRKTFRVKTRGRGSIYNIYGSIQNDIKSISNSIVYFIGYDSVEID